MSSHHTMDPTTASAARRIPRGRGLLGVLGLVVAVAAAMPGAASATNLFTLDSNPASGASAAVAVDSAGTGYFGWERNGGAGPNVAMFCKVPRGGTCTTPIALPTPPAGFGGVIAVDAAYPVLGSGSTVYVVGPRFIGHDVVLWTSTNGGVTFSSPPTATTNSGVSEGSNPTDVLAAPSGGFYVSSHNPGLAFTNVPASGTGSAPVTDLAPGAFASDSTLGLVGGGTTGNPVEAFGIFGTPSTINFRSYSGTGSLNNESSWTAPSQVSQGVTPSLAGGPSGLFLASEDTDAAGNYTQVNVRKYTPGSGFGTPVATLQTDTSLDNGGRIFQTPGGRVLVAWVGQPGADRGVPIRLYQSTTGGAPFTRVGNVAVGAPNDAIYLIRMAAADDGQGFVSFHEIGSGLLRVADLTPIKSATSIVTALASAGRTPAAKITVGPGTAVTDTAAIIGPGGTIATGATGTVSYFVYSDAACKTLVRTGGTTAVSGGTSASVPITLPVGTWYYLVQYSGDVTDFPSTSACGAEVVTVAPASVSVAGIIFVGGKLVIHASFNTRGKVLVTTQITNASVLLHGRNVLASAAKKAGCKSGQALLNIGKKKKCVATFGTTTKSIPAAGAYKIQLSPNAPARRALKKGRTLHVKVTLTFKAAAGGKPAVRSKSITVKPKKK